MRKGNSRHHLRFQNFGGKKFDVFSMENYVVSRKDIEDFTEVLKDEPVRRYITDDAMKRFGHETPESLARDILENSALRWEQDAERRFLVRDQQGHAVGMIGVTLKDKTQGELWYYKVSSVPPFMYEALQIVLGFLKQEGICNLSATFEGSNEYSRQILAKIGFQESQPGEVQYSL